MKGYALTLLVVVFSILQIQGQIVQKGRVTLINSSKTGVQGVEILVSGASATVTDGRGEFQLVFPRQKAGESFTVVSIAKQGFEVVNEREIDNRTLSEELELSIVLCLRGELEQSRRNFYRIGANLYQKRYQSGVEELNLLKSENVLDQKGYAERLATLSAEYAKAREKLEFYADKFARMNKDELSELDKKAMTLLEKGEVDQAIRLYEDSGILEQFLEKTAIRDSARLNITDYKQVLLRQVQLYREQNDTLSLLKANEIIDRVLLRWPNDIDFKRFK